MARWKNEDPRRYQSFDLNLKAAADYELIQDFARNQSAKRIYAAHVRVIKTVMSIAHGVRDFHRKIKDQRKKVVELINRVKNSIGLKHALRFFNISIHTFRNWSQQSHTACFESLTNNCNKVYPGQLSKFEVMKLKECLSDNQQFQYWPISSIALHTLRNNILPISLNTWYTYANKLGISRPKPFSRRKKNNVSIRAKNPHAIWHADITRFVTADNVKHYIYVVVDNYSRKILSWSIADAVKSEYRKLTIQQAIENTKTSYPEITLITDGGPEKQTPIFSEFVSTSHRTQNCIGRCTLLQFTY